MVRLAAVAVQAEVLAVEIVVMKVLETIEQTRLAHHSLVVRARGERAVNLDEHAVRGDDALKLDPVQTLVPGVVGSLQVTRRAVVARTTAASERAVDERPAHFERRACVCDSISKVWYVRRPQIAIKLVKIRKRDSVKERRHSPADFRDLTGTALEQELKVEQPARVRKPPQINQKGLLAVKTEVGSRKYGWNTERATQDIDVAAREPKEVVEVTRRQRRLAPRTSPAVGGASAEKSRSEVDAVAAGKLRNTLVLKSCLL